MNPSDMTVHAGPGRHDPEAYSVPGPWVIQSQAAKAGLKQDDRFRQRQGRIIPGGIGVNRAPIRRAHGNCLDSRAWPWTAVVDPSTGKMHQRVQPPCEIMFPLDGPGFRRMPQQCAVSCLVARAMGVQVPLWANKKARSGVARGTCF